jgi:hypothetical protein
VKSVRIPRRCHQSGGNIGYLAKRQAAIVDLSDKCFGKMLSIHALTAICVFRLSNNGLEQL